MSKKIKHSRLFKKHFKVRILNNFKLSSKYFERFELFLINPNDPMLDDHGLTGTMIGKRSFSITGDYRVVYGLDRDNIVLYDVGTHNQVY